MLKKITVSSTDNLQNVIDNLDNTSSYEILLLEGIYFQRVKINKNNIRFIADKKNSVFINYNSHAYMMNKDNLLNGTFRTATTIITGNNIYFNNINFQNSSGLGIDIGQGLAVAIYGDNIYFENCSFLGTHDTLFLGPLPEDLISRYSHILPSDERINTVTNTFFKNCNIEGTVDYIFGSGNAVFFESVITSLSKGYIAAPSTYENNNYGIIFYKSKIVNSSTSPIFLARPWREFAKCYFIECSFIGNIESNRYEKWNKENFYFYEYPYIKSNFSLPLSDSNYKRITSYINQKVKTN